MSVRAAAVLLSLAARAAGAAEPSQPSLDHNAARVTLARQHFEAGRQALATGRLDDALVELRAASELVLSPAVLFALADAHYRAGERVQAARRLLACLRARPPAPGDRAELEAALHALETPDAPLPSGTLAALHAADRYVDAPELTPPPTPQPPTRADHLRDRGVALVTTGTVTTLGSAVCVYLGAAAGLSDFSANKNAGLLLGIGTPLLIIGQVMLGLGMSWWSVAGRMPAHPSPLEWQRERRAARRTAIGGGVAAGVSLAVAIVGAVVLGATYSQQATGAPGVTAGGTLTGIGAAALVPSLIAVGSGLRRLRRAVILNPAGISGSF